MKYLTRTEQAAYLKEKYNLKVSPKTLQKLATIGGGPEYDLFGNKAVSTPEKMDAWVQQKLSPPRER